MLSSAIGGVTSLALFLGIVSLCVFVAGKALADQPAAARLIDHSPLLGPKLIQEDVRIPAQGGHYEVAATILRPQGEGPFGVVVLNHGVPGSEAERVKESAAADFNAAAPVFARRGYVVVMPMRRGFGAITLSIPMSVTPRRMNGATEPGRSMPCASPVAATAPP